MTFDEAVKEYGLVPIGGSSEGYTLHAIKGYDYIGPSYDKIRPRVLSSLHERARALKAQGDTDTQIIRGSYKNVFNAWPIIVQFSGKARPTDIVSVV